MGTRVLGMRTGIYVLGMRMRSCYLPTPPTHRGAGAGVTRGVRAGLQMQRIRGGWCCESARGRGLVGALGDVALWAAALDAAAVAAVARGGAPARAPLLRLSLRFRAGAGAGGPEAALLWSAVARDDAGGARDGSLVGTPRPSVHHPPPPPTAGG
jgi:hypothetical protein